MELSQSSLYGEQLFNFYQTAEATVSVKAAQPTNSCRQLPTVHLHAGMLLSTFTPVTHKAQVTEVAAIQHIYFEKCQKFSCGMKAFVKDMNEKLSCVKNGCSHRLLYFSEREQTPAVFLSASCHSFYIQFQKQQHKQQITHCFLSNGTYLSRYYHSYDSIWLLNVFKDCFS